MLLVISAGWGETAPACCCCCRSGELLLSSGVVLPVGGGRGMEMGCGSGRVVAPLTVKTARASNPRGTAAMWIRDRLDVLFVDEDFAAWYPSDGRPGLSPARPGSRWCRCCNVGLGEYLSPGITPPCSPRPRSHFPTLFRNLPT
jgi:hypothetical protein